MDIKVNTETSISGEHPQKVAWRLIFNQHLENTRDIERACKSAITTARYCLAVADRYNQLEKIYWEAVIKYIVTVYEQRKNQGEIDKSKDQIGI
jgi:hypothetical protein